MPSVIRSAIALSAALLAACSSRDSADARPEATPATPAAEPTAVTITATDYGFVVPAQITAGPTNFHFLNQGKELHHAVLVRLDSGKTVQDVAVALQNPGPPPQWAHWVGGPNAADPSGESNAAVTLAPGRYVVLCLIPSPDGVPHFAKGMIASFEATGAGPSVVSMPKPDVTVRLSDYAFALSTPLTPGTRTIRVINDGPQPHELVLVKFAPGKSLKDLAAWEAGGAKGPPPGNLLGGASPMDAGMTTDFRASLEPGDYALLCFLPDAKDGKPHLEHGMALPLKIG